jgi:glucan phosphoethanolaminetransferase (alkaline phosphatase superfamily)
MGNVMVHKQDVELQIRLAELQADIQIYLTAVFGFLAGFLALIIGYMQIFFTLPWEESFMATRIVFAVVIIILIVGCGVSIIHFVRKVVAFRNEIEELRKEYSW